MWIRISCRTRGGGGKKKKKKRVLSMHQMVSGKRSVLKVFFSLNRYGNGVGMYRTHLFGSPSIIACEPSINKFILQSDDLFKIRWPSVELVGRYSLAAVEGEPHTRLRTFLLNAINKPEALKKISLAVQPRIISSLRRWADEERIKASHETNKVTASFYRIITTVSTVIQIFYFIV